MPEPAYTFTLPLAPAEFKHLQEMAQLTGQTIEELIIEAVSAAYAPIELTPLAKPVDLPELETQALPTYGSAEEAALLDKLSRIFGAAGPVSAEIIEDRGER